MCTMKHTNTQTVLTLLTLGLFSLFIRGYSYGAGNHRFQLPMIFKAVKDSLYPNDYLFAFNHGNSFYYSFVAFFNQFMGIEHVLFFLYVIATFFYVLAVYKLSYYLFKNKLIGYLAVLLLIIMKPSLGTDMTFRAITYHITLAIPILLFSLYFFLRQRYIWSFLLLGTGFNLHALSAFHLLALYGIYFILRFTHINKLRYILGAALFFIITAPLILFSDTTSHSLFSADPSWVSLLKGLDFSHSFPFQWSAHHYLITIVLLVVGVLSYVSLHRMTFFKSNKETHHNILTFCVGFIFLGIMGVVFTQLYPIEFVIAAQLFRSTLFLSTLIVIYASAFMYHLFHSKCAFATYVSFALFASLFFYDYVALYLLLPALVYLLYKKNVPYLKPVMIVGYGISVILLLLYSLFTQDYAILTAIMRHVSVPFIIFIVLCVLFYFFTFIPQRTFPQNYTSFILVLIVFSGASLYWHEDSFSEHFGYPYVPSDNPWMNTMLWIEQETPETALFLIPPHRREFRAFAKRSVYVETDSGPVYFSKDAADEWVTRLTRIGVHPSDITTPTVQEAYRSLSAEDILVLAQEYGIDHVVYPLEPELDFPVLYENTGYRVYALP